MTEEIRKKYDMTSVPPQQQIRPGSMAPNASISRKLKEFYDAVQEEGIPDRFLDLLERLEQAENAHKVGARAVDAK
jgi:predicted transcriptional regulator